MRHPAEDPARIPPPPSTKPEASNASHRTPFSRITRRNLLLRTGYGAGAAALSTLLDPGLLRAAQSPIASASAGLGLPGLPHFAPKAKRVIYMFMAGGPSHIDTWDHKPALEQLHGQELPDSVRGGQRLTGMTSGQKSFPVVKSHFAFSQHGDCGRWVSSLLPHTAGIVDDIAVVKSMHTEAVNHDPGITFINTGSQQPGKPAIAGAWLSYGLGSANENMPAYVVMISRGKGNLQALYSRLWGSGFLPCRAPGGQAARLQATRSSTSPTQMASPRLRPQEDPRWAG